MARRWTWKAAAGAAAVTGVLASGMVPAQARTTPGWRVVKDTGPAGQVSRFVNIVATGSGNAWAAGYRGDAPLFDHWNGRTWQQRPLPAAMAAAYPAFSAFGASSAANAWAIARQQDSGYAALTWNGQQWTAATLPSWVVRISMIGSPDDVPIVLGRKNVWNFSLAAITSPALAARYNGHSWRKVYLPGEPIVVSALSASDIWAIGPTRKTMSLPAAQQAYVAMHWNGQRWRTVAIPVTRLGLSQPGAVQGLAVLGPRDVWAGFPVSSPAGHTTGYLVHWNGRKWSRVRTPSGAFNVPGGAPAAQDGHGGLWLQGFGPAPADTPRMYHYSHGNWTTYSAPLPASVQLAELAWIPGTRSVWAAGQDVGAADDTIRAVIAKYGR
jgi:hypothetical protein